MIKVNNVSELKDHFISKKPEQIFQLNNLIITIKYNWDYFFLVTQDNVEVEKGKESRKKILIKRLSEINKKYKKKEKIIEKKIENTNFDITIEEDEPEMELEKESIYERLPEFSLNLKKVTNWKPIEVWLNRLLRSLWENGFIYESEIPSVLKGKEELKKILSLLNREEDTYEIVNVLDYLKDKEKYFNEFIKKVHQLGWIYKNII